MDWHREVKKHQRMFMAVENMAHANMTVNYIIISEKKSPLMMKYRKQEIRNSSQRNVKYAAFLNQTSTGMNSILGAVTSTRDSNKLTF